MDFWGSSRESLVKQSPMFCRGSERNMRRRSPWSWWRLSKRQLAWCPRRSASWARAPPGTQNSKQLTTSDAHCVRWASAPVLQKVKVKKGSGRLPQLPSISVLTIYIHTYIYTVKNYEFNSKSYNFLYHYLFSYFPIYSRGSHNWLDLAAYYYFLVFLLVHRAIIRR